MKCRLRETPLPQPEIAFARQQSVAEKLPVLAKNAAFDEFAIVGDENLLDVVGVAHEKDAEIVVAHRDDVAVVALEFRHVGERVLAVNFEARCPGFRRWAGRKFGWGGSAHDSTISRQAIGVVTGPAFTQFDRIALKRNPPEREVSFTFENPAAERRSAMSARSIGTKTLPTWITRCSRLSSISNAKNEPPGRNTRNTSRNALSWAVRVRKVMQHQNGNCRRKGSSCEWQRGSIGLHDSVLDFWQRAELRNRGSTRGSSPAERVAAMPRCLRPVRRPTQARGLRANSRQRPTATDGRA